MLHSLEKATGGIDLNMNVDKMDYKCFTQEWRFSEISKQVHVPRQWRLINWKWG